jgi:gas vesicle protein
MAQSRALAASLTGAVIGAIAGYLLATDQGRALRRRLERGLTDFSHDLNDLRRLTEEGASLFGEAWTAIRAALPDPGREPQRFPLDRRASAF